MYKTKHFVTGSFVSHAKFVDDAAYSAILDNIVKATCDVFLVHVRAGDNGEGQVANVLLGKRVGLPHNSWWIPGGRMLPGEQAAFAARRLLSRELSVDLVPRDANLSADTEAQRVLLDRVNTVAHFTFVWDTRTQPPVENGTCDVSLIVEVEVTDEEAASVVHKPREYSHLAWVPLSTLVDDIRAAPNDELGTSSKPTLPLGEPLLHGACDAAVVPPGRKLHPALRQGLLELDAMMAWRRVQRAVVEEGRGERSAAFVVEALRAFMKAKGELPA